MQAETFRLFWLKSPQYWFNELKSNPKGLTEEEAASRIATSSNKKTSKSSFEKDVTLFLSQFKNPLMLLLIGATVISYFLGDTSDVIIILFIVISGSLLSFFQERNAGKVVEKLKHLIEIKSTVIRNGILTEVNANNIVPGDIIQLIAGDIIPADCLLFEINELHVNESSLTGESFPCLKQLGNITNEAILTERFNSVWQGTNVVSGSAKAVVINVGENTMFSETVKSSGTTIITSFETGIKNFGFLLMRITLFLSAGILVINLINHQSPIESALFALALAVGMAPELLPAIITIAMSAGANKMLQKKVIVKKLSSIQNLGEINLVCTDKTGTITEGIISVEAITDGFGNNDNWIKEIAYWNACYQSGYNNPIDESLKSITITPSFQPKKLDEIPYDFTRKRVSVLINANQQNYLICKGAFNEVLSVCNYIKLPNNGNAPIKDYLPELENYYTQLGSKGSRVIAIAYTQTQASKASKQDEKELVFVGFIELADPIKEDIAAIISELSTLQIQLKIITGDNKNVAQSIAKKLGITNPVVITGKELQGISKESLAKLAPTVHIFSEVEPLQKEQIIIALKQNFTLAYLGDGINDVGALNAADVGISVNNAVDVAREAADFVLLEKNLNVLIDGVTEGRKTFANTLKYIYINTGSTFGNMISVAIASLMLPYLPMLPKQILLTNFITDFPYLSVATDNVDDKQLKQPGKWNFKLIRNYMIIFGLHSTLFDVITFCTLFFIFKAPESVFQSAWFIESVLTELFILFIIRTHQNFFKSNPSKMLLLLSFVGLIITVGLPYTSLAPVFGMVILDAKTLGSIVAIVTLYLLTADLIKVWFFKKYTDA